MLTPHARNFQRVAVVVITGLFLLVARQTAFAEVSGEEKSSAAEVVAELDPYYTAISLHMPLGTSDIPELREAGEFEVYRHLASRILRPHFLVIEAAVFPMPLLGVYLKSNHRAFYDDARILGDVNVVESVTAGFQEPYALTFFLGDVVSFVRPGETRKGTNKGYMGYMLSFADKHIKDNVLVPDKSLEIELKMKGDRIFHDDRLSWSFRVGTKIHQNRNIADVVYVGLRRSNCDFYVGVLSWLKNSNMEMKVELSAQSLAVLRQEYIIGKKYPLKKPHLALKLDMGVIWENDLKYSGNLRTSDSDTTLFVVRPSIEF